MLAHLLPQSSGNQAIRFSALKAMQPKALRFEPKVSIRLKVGNFTVKTASGYRDLAAARRLRYQVFHREFAGKLIPFGTDREAYDKFGDILMVVDDRNHKVVGTYRLIPSTHSNHFYSQSEFDITGILALPGTKVELSRACIHKKYRQGRIINLLWRGIATYMKAIDGRYVFGCGSIQTTDAMEAGKIVASLEHKGLYTSGMDVRVAPTYLMPGFGEALELARLDQVELQQDVTIPSLMKSYFKAGARVCSEPALDRKFRCIDLLTIMDLKQSSQNIERRYLN